VGSFFGAIGEWVEEDIFGAILTLIVVLFGTCTNWIWGLLLAPAGTVGSMVVGPLAITVYKALWAVAVLGVMFAIRFYKKYKRLTQVRRISAKWKRRMVAELAKIPTQVAVVSAGTPSEDVSVLCDDLTEVLDAAQWPHLIPGQLEFVSGVGEGSGVAIYSLAKRQAGKGLAEKCPQVELLMSLLTRQGISAYWVYTGNLPDDTLFIEVHPGAGVTA
jgi:hypothetical protein